MPLRKSLRRKSNKKSKRIMKGGQCGDTLKRLKRSMKGGGDFLFASANELWRASLDTIDFMPLSSVNYSGGIIITDWYSEDGNTKEAIKITVRFLSNEIQSNSIKIIVHNKNCGPAENCTVSEIDTNITVSYTHLTLPTILRV